MHFNVAQRVANRLDPEIRVLSRMLPEQMTAGSERAAGRNSPAAQLPAPSSLWFCPSWRTIPPPWENTVALSQRGAPHCPSGTSLASPSLAAILLVLNSPRVQEGKQSYVIGAMALDGKNMLAAPTCPRGPGSSVRSLSSSSQQQDQELIRTVELVATRSPAESVSIL